MEERTARLEATVEHIQSDVTEMKGDIRRIDAKIDAVKESVAALSLEMKALESRMLQAFSALEKSRVLDKVWWLLIAGALLGVMARGFRWL